MSIQMAELLYTSPPVYDASSIAKRAEELVQSGIELPEDDSANDTLLFFHTNHPVAYKDGAAPAQTAILATAKAVEPKAYADGIQQSWCCGDAADRVGACTASRLVTEMMASGLVAGDLARLFHGVLQAFVEVTDPHAISFGHSQQIVSPADYLESCSNEPIQRLSALNVRFFNIANSDSDDMIMDICGLEAVGLHDLQCHFRDLDPNDVSQVLFNTALYLFDNGPVIESGQTVAGTGPNARWQCEFETSLLEPTRELLDLSPGAPYAAGKR
jgi:hypothetical protein